MGGTILHFDYWKKEVFHRVSTMLLFFSVLSELKKRPKGTRYIMSNMRQCLTSLKILNFLNWWELKLAG